MEIEELKEKLKKWEACADRLFVWADEVRCGTTNQALYESVKEDIIKYNKYLIKNDLYFNTNNHIQICVSLLLSQLL